MIPKVNRSDDINTFIYILHLQLSMGVQAANPK